MQPNRQAQLLAGINNGIEESGYSAVLLPASRVHPRKYLLSDSSGNTISVWLYIWTLTPGGRPSLPHEYRIQMTTVTSPLHMNPNGPTVLMGYEPTLNMFAGFDLVRHQTFTTGSPSVQIDIRTLQQARQDGFAFDKKTNGEIAVGIRPDQLVPYITNSFVLHGTPMTRDSFEILESVASLQTVPLASIESLPTKRQRVVQTVSKLTRSANFRQQVLHGYGFTCAVARTQLRLLDAAHILPVGAPGSVDDIRNGLALSPTYHRAYDRGLIYLDENFTMRINPAKELELQAANLTLGIDNFRNSLGTILMPPDRRQWPDPGLIRRANAFRGIQI